MNFYVNQKIKVKDQDITGTVVRLYDTTAVILDDSGKMWSDVNDDGTLEFRFSDLESA